MSGFGPYFTQTLGSMYGYPSAGNNLVPVSGFDEDPEVAGEAQQLTMAGWSPAAALQHARQRAALRRMQGGSRCAHFGPGRNAQVGFDDDDDDDDDVGDDEIEELGADDEDIGDDDDGPHVLGANASRISERIQKLEEKRADVKRELRETPTWRKRKRARLQRKLGRIEARIARKSGRLRAKNEKMMRKYGRVPAAVTGREPTVGMGLERLANFPSNGLYMGSAPRGVELTLPIKWDGSLYLSGTFAASAPAGSQLALSGETDPINYADFQVTAFEITVQTQFSSNTIAAGDPWGGPGTNQIIVSSCQSLEVNGNVNAFYDDQVYPGSGMVLSHSKTLIGESTTWRTTGLRNDAILDKNGTVSLAGLVEIVGSPSTAGLVVVSASVTCQALRDSVLDRR